MANNTVTHEGKTYTRKGKVMTHAVVTVSRKTFRPDGAPTVLIEWASSLELAQKNNSAHLARAEKVARTGTLPGWCFDPRFYSPENFVDSVIVPATHV